jgi:hypothetical protein
MDKFFNVAGPCIAKLHYMLDAANRLQGIEGLIDHQQYFVIHAARQTGKTSLLLDMVQRLNASGNYCALYCSLETVQGITDAKEGIPAILSSLKLSIRHSTVFSFFTPSAVLDANADYSVALLDFLSDLSGQSSIPVVVFFDEADCLSEQTMISFLRQLLNGYNSRAQTAFVHSLALVGMRNIRDFKAHIRSDTDTLGSASPFNIVTESLLLRNFNQPEVAELLGQHVAAQGQVFEQDAIDLIWQQTCGQPWLVNALAHECVAKLLGNDYTKPITAELVQQAIQNIILRRDTHIDSLLERLKEPRVRSVIEPIISGELGGINKQSDDYLYTYDLGLIRDHDNRLEPANPIYAEVIIRTLSYNTQESIRHSENDYSMPKYLRNGKIDMNYLLSDFQELWRENSAIWVDKFDYKEAAPHLILMAFLQRVVNGGGQIVREMAAERRRLDLCVIYQGNKYPIELKIYRAEKTYTEGIEQTARYMQSLGCSEGWLVVFDRRPGIAWEQRLFARKEKIGESKLTIIGC